VKRIVAVCLVVAVLATLSALAVDEIEISATASMTIVPHGYGSNGVLGARNYSVQFYLDRPGQLAGSWAGDGTGPWSSVLYFTSSCRETSNEQGPADVECAGNRLWTGESNVTHDSINYSAESATYTLVWESQNRTDSPYVTVWTPLHWA
jgi:hypothetical protein